MTAIDKAALIEQAASAYVDGAAKVLDIIEGPILTWADVDERTRTGIRGSVLHTLPVIAKALLAPLRELHRPAPLTGLWGDCANGDGECGHIYECPEETRDVCTECDHTVTDADWQGFKTYPCPTVRLLDAIESELA